MSMLTDTMRSMDVSRVPDSPISYVLFPYHMPPARVLVRFPFHFTCLSTLPIWTVNSSMLTILSYAYSFRLVDSSVESLFLDYDSFTFYICLYLYLAVHYIYGWGWGLVPHLQSTLQPP